MSPTLLAAAQLPPPSTDLFLFLFLLWFNVPVNNFSVMLRRATYSWVFPVLLGSKCLLLKETNTPTRPRIEPGSPDPESDALTIRPVRPPSTDLCLCFNIHVCKKQIFSIHSSFSRRDSPVRGQIYLLKIASIYGNFTPIGA